MRTFRFPPGLPVLCRLAAVAGCLTLLSACENAREALGLEKQSPDEFEVVTRPPLSMPPDYGLRPPRPGAPRPQEAEVKDSARNLLVKEADAAKEAATRGVSSGEMALLNKAGATSPDPTIRQKVNRDSSILASEDESFVDRLIFWQEKPPAGTVVDADREARRLRENAALGDPVTKGRTPKIERKPKGWLEGLFN